MESGNNTLLSAMGGTELGIFTRGICVLTGVMFVWTAMVVTSLWFVVFLFLTEAGPLSAPLSSTPPTNTLWSSLKYSVTEVAGSGSVFLAAHTQLSDQRKATDISEPLSVPQILTCTLALLLSDGVEGWWINRGMHFGHFANKEDGIAPHPRSDRQLVDFAAGSRCDFPDFGPQTLRSIGEWCLVVFWVYVMATCLNYFHVSSRFLKNNLFFFFKYYSTHEAGPSWSKFNTVPL